MDEPTPAEAVVVAYVNGNQVTYSWHHSMIELIGHDMANGARVLRGGYIAMRHGTGGLVEARNKAVQTFLTEGKADWLFWVDTDMGFAPDTIDRLVASADRIERPIVAALCFSQRELHPDGMGGWRCQATPTIYDWVQAGEQQGFAVNWDYPRDGLVRCAGTGSAAILIHRSVFEKIAAKFGPIWYNRVPNRSMGEITSEDLSFCMHAGAAGIPVHVDTSVKTTHQKLLWLGEPDFEQQHATHVTPPATESTAVIVPTMRPQNAEPFMKTLRASTGVAKVYAICAPDDGPLVKAWAEAGAEVILGDAEWVGDAEQPLASTFAERVNLGYRQTNEPWLFLVGDDVRFHAGWLDHAQAAADGKYHVIGTNDLANPRVTAGEHATHMLIRRSYIDEVGASWDGPKVVAHEGYRHCFVDDEIVTAAKERGVWVMALGSRVEHLHPAWGTAPMDEVYGIGEAHLAEDAEKWRRRLANHGQENA